MKDKQRPGHFRFRIWASAVLVISLMCSLVLIPLAAGSTPVEASEISSAKTTERLNQEETTDPEGSLQDSKQKTDQEITKNDQQTADQEGQTQADQNDVNDLPASDAAGQTENSRQDSSADQSAEEEQETTREQESDPTENGDAEEQLSSQKTLSVSNNLFTLELYTEDPDELADFVAAHPGMKISLEQTPANTEQTQDDEAQILLLNQNYQLLFMQDNQEIAADTLQLKGKLQFQPSLISGLYQRSQDDADSSLETGALIQIAGSSQDELLEEYVSIQESDPEEMSFALSSTHSFQLKVSVPDPAFTVQYYVNTQVPVKAGTAGDATIPVIDSSKKGFGATGDANGKGGVMPTNSALPKTFDLQLTGSNSAKKIQTEDKLIPFYDQADYTYHKAPNPNYFNKLLHNGNYELKEIWILKDGKNPESTDQKDWNVYPKDSKFTNNPQYQQTHPDVILIQNGMLMRMVYDQDSGKVNVPANFYDYDISNKTDSNGAHITSSGGSATKNDWGNAYGINSNANYSKPDQATGKLAFGNMNTGTHLGKVLWTDPQGQQNNLNMYNRAASKNYKGCTFGLVSGLEGDEIQYSKGVFAPDLFSSKPAVGKIPYEDSQMVFTRSGDTYTLQSVKLNKNGTLTTASSKLNQFSHPGNYTTIWTNNFWPMDSVPGVDGLSGGSTPVYWKGFQFNNNTWNNYTGAMTSKGTFPASDDGVAHNPLFGLQYQVDFELTEDYQGPLDYIFFGDDDMWVFLDGKPVVDIGGIHSSVGQYVNLWDYIPHGDSGKHTLKFYYTERGLSGSTCYMQFTLPSVSVAQPSHNTGNLAIAKKVDASIDDPDKEYEFEIRLRDADGNELPDEYAYTKYDVNGQPIENNIILRDSQTFTLKAGEYILCNFLPNGTVFTVTETDAGQATKVETSTGETFYPVNGEGNKKIPAITGTVSKDSTVTYTFDNMEPKNKIQISKAIRVNDENQTLPVTGTENQEYLFRILKEDGSNLFPAGTLYQISGEGIEMEESRELSEDGIIRLKKGQLASFENSYLNQNIRYFVQELVDPQSLALYGEIQVDGTAATDAGEITLAGNTYHAFNAPQKDTAASDPDNPENTSFDWDNVLDKEKYGTLSIEKKIGEGINWDPDDSRTFTFHVSLNGEPVPDGTIYTIDGQEYAFENGILQLKPGQKAVIANLLASTEYEVTEEESPDFQAVLSQNKGTVGLQANVVVSATNTPAPKQISIEKTDPDGIPLSRKATFALYSSIPGSEENPKEEKEFQEKTYYYESDIEVSGKAQIEDLIPSASYVLVETKSPDGYALLSSPIYFHLNLDGTIVLEEGSDKNAVLMEDGFGLSVADAKIPQLPDAGGTGMEWTFALGVAVLIGAVVVLEYRRRKNHEPHKG